MKKLMNEAQSFINLEEKLNTQFGNLIVADVNSSLPTGKDSHR